MHYYVSIHWYTSSYTHILMASPVLQGPREEGGGGPGREKLSAMRPLLLAGSEPG